MLFRSFKNGVQGMMDMVKQSIALKVNMDSILKLSDDFTDPEKTMEFASNMQMLGGSFAQLGDFNQLMYDAAVAPEDLAKNIAKATASMGSFNKETGKIKIYNKVINLQSNYDDIQNGIDAVMERIKIDMDYLSHKQKLPTRNFKKRSHDTHIDESMKKIQKTIPLQHQTIPDQSQITQNPFPGLVMVIDKPSPELVSKLFTMNINYTFLPEFLIKQMLNIHNSIPPPISSPVQQTHPQNPYMSHIPTGILPSFVQNGHHDPREEGEI